ncbi:hypothetical protein A2680_00515 [Candidatus Kaiserbacteria bacterium RIFCSPHIGHO2_01_FULL_55_37]|nr:MAG: hypothetical protein A2680_00515 [Candidatus Kaiserbacteria bacterium RIFCSPHIGHO2_01_FULL_55_37]
MTDNQTSAPLHVAHPRRVSWLTIILALLAVGTFIAIAQPNAQYYVPQMMEGFTGSTFKVTSTDPAVPQGIQVNYAESSGAPVSVQGTMMARGTADSRVYYPPPAPDYNPNVPVTDTREFLKVNYNSSMQTRDVQGLTRRVETTVRGYDGRIDQESSTPRSGYVSFVIPQSKYEAFRAELESLVDSRFLTVNISSQNLLPQKQSIEEQQKQADTSLAGYETARQKLVSSHATTLKSYQSQIDSDTQQLASLRASLSNTGDPVQQTQIYAQIQAVSNDLLLLRAQLNNENASYGVQLKNADANIKSAKDWQKAVKTQDQALLDNVATVNGTVSVQWISLWEMAQLYLPGYWIPAIFAALAFISYLFDRRRFGTT